VKAVQALLAQPGVLLVLKTLASLVGVLLVVQLARWMNLGGDVRIRDEDHAGALADEAMCGFVPVAVGLDKARIGALVRDAQGRVMLIRRHGSHFAARLLENHAGVRLDQHFLTVATGDSRFGTVTLNLGPEAQAWAASLRRLEG